MTLSEKLSWMLHVCGLLGSGKNIDLSNPQSCTTMQISRVYTSTLTDCHIFLWGRGKGKKLWSSLLCFWRTRFNLTSLNSLCYALTVFDGRKRHELLLLLVQWSKLGPYKVLLLIVSHWDWLSCWWLVMQMPWHYIGF